jgi:AraC-like DNA-binding protein
VNRAVEPTSVAHRETAAAPLVKEGRPRIYRLHAGALDLTRAYLALSRGVSVQEIRLRAGGVRIDGRISPGALKIVFLRAEEIRVLGNRVSGEAMAIAYGGSRLDVAANRPGSAVALYFSPAVARCVVTEEALPALRRRMEGPLGLETLLSPVTQRGRALARSARGLLEQARQKGAWTRAWPPALEAEAVVETSAALIRDILGDDRSAAQTSVKRRRELALMVENLLWETPFDDGLRRLSLDDAAVRLRCSRRSIQLALQDEFGLGFTALKRLIRLQQVHAILRRRPAGRGVGRVAKAYEFNHLGRFAGHYRDMFGVLPSVELSPGSA